MLMCACSHDDQKEPVLDSREASYFDLPLFFRFQDIYGNDLVKGIAHNPLTYHEPLRKNSLVEFYGVDTAYAVQRDFYTLEMIDPVYEKRNEVADRYAQDMENRLLLYEMKGNYYLGFSTYKYKNEFSTDLELAKRMENHEWIYKLRCTYVFGDDAEHVIVARENETGGVPKVVLSFKFDGKECAAFIHHVIYITVILDRK